MPNWAPTTARQRGILADLVARYEQHAAEGAAAAHPNLCPWCAWELDLPAAYPGGSFDLVVASDVLYYWTPDDLIRAVGTIEESLEPGGRFVSLHYALRVNAAVSKGDAVHEMLRAHHVLTNVLQESLEIGEGRPYHADVWERPTASAAQ